MISEDMILTEREPDVAVVFKFNGAKKHPLKSGYRPAHLICEGYLTTGLHRYENVDMVLPDGIAKGTITFLSPSAYLHCLWVGKEIPIQEGERVVGYATIIKILNTILEIEKKE